MFKPTLKQLLEQPDYSGLDYEDGGESATVVCPVINFSFFGGGRGVYYTNKI